MSKSVWQHIAEAPMDWDTSDLEPVAPASKRDPKRPPPTPIRSRKSLRAESYDNEVWNVTNTDTGQVFHNVPGRTPMDAKRYVMRSAPGMKVDTLGLNLKADPVQSKGTTPPEPGATRFVEPPDRTARYQRNAPIDTDVFLGAGTPSGGDPDSRSGVAAQNIRRPQGTPNATVNFRAGRPRHAEPNSSDFAADDDSVAEPPTHVDQARRRPRHEASVGGSLVGYQMPYPEASEDELKERLYRNMLEIVRKKKGGGGYVLYSPNKGKKRKPKPVGEFPTRAAAKAAELARFPPKNAEHLKKARKRVDKLKKDPKARARAERSDLTGRKRVRRSGAPTRSRRKAQESMTNALGRDLMERLFHEDEVPGSPWDERVAAMNPDHIAGDKKLSGCHKTMQGASASALAAAQKQLTRILKKVAKVNGGDVAHDPERRKAFMPVMLDVGGAEVGPVHLYIDGGHVKIEVSRDARRQISELDPDTAMGLRGSLITFEEDYLPTIDAAKKAWSTRDAHLDGLSSRVEKAIGGMSDIERHLARELLKGRRGDR